MVAPSLQLLLLFFFQAEDGIRDLTVTGVQTCALPISAAQFLIAVAPFLERNLVLVCLDHVHDRFPVSIGLASTSAALFPAVCLCEDFEIGRASCRERV